MVLRAAQQISIQGRNMVIAAAVWIYFWSNPFWSGKTLIFGVGYQTVAKRTFILSLIIRFHGLHRYYKSLRPYVLRQYSRSYVSALELLLSAIRCLPTSALALPLLG